MAETDNIAKLATPVAAEIFNVFGWTFLTPQNENFACKTEAHKKETHPVDAVFWYDHPYNKERIYINTDLKSYKKSSITKVKITESLRSLAMSVECADKNSEWHKVFVDPQHNFKILGMLFLFNHDEDYDLSLNEKYMRISEKEIKQEKNIGMYLFSPTLIRYLQTLCIDLRQDYTKKAKPSEKTYQFFYPNLITKRAQRQYWNSATIESLVGPWLVIKYVDADSKSEKIRMYSNAKGSVDEWKYAIDYLFRYQLVGKDQQIGVRMPFCLPDAANNFEIAKEQYFSHFFGSLSSLPDAEKLKDSIVFEKVDIVSKRFTVG